MNFNLDNNKLFLIAEIGINHNGIYNFAIRLIDNAKKAGFDAVKFQTFIPEHMTHAKTKLAEYQKKTKFKNMQLMLKEYNFSHEQFYKIKKYCDKRKILFFSTPFDLESAIFLNKINVKAFKISSGDLDNFYLLSKIKQFKKPIIISTGMSNNKEIQETINFLDLPKSKLAILHCVSDYPTEIKNTFFSNFNYLKKFKYTVGFSDHTLGSISSSIAVAMGGMIIEKHITLDNKMNGPDHACSMQISDLKLFVKTLRDVRTSITAPRILTPLERNTIKVARKSLYYAKNLEKLSAIEFNDLIPLRPARNNISPKFYKIFLGKKIKCNVKKNTPVKISDILK
jgi:N,N'-diacetyllegionaminate synthase